jgi:RNA polymerase sigma-70 factor (family 1)
MNQYKTFSDIELTDLLRLEDRLAFTEIYNRYWPPLFLHVRRMLSDEDQAQDVVQELFVWLWKKAGVIEFSTSLSSYLYSSVRNRVFNQIKHEKVKASYFSEISAYMKEGEFLVDEQLRLKELTTEIESEIMKMPEKMREIFELSRKQHLSHKEIAEMLGLSEHTVRKQVQRALLRLRERLGMPAMVILLICYVKL